MHVFIEIIYTKLSLRGIGTKKKLRTSTPFLTIKIKISIRLTASTTVRATVDQIMLVEPDGTLTNISVNMKARLNYLNLLAISPVTQTNLFPGKLLHHLDFSPHY